MQSLPRPHVRRGKVTVKIRVVPDDKAPEQVMRYLLERAGVLSPKPPVRMAA